ncbi:MAG: biotin/lipoyl-containing protein [Acidobacteriota bacterium]|nr:hypothetical protein [Blastocatellia bacterium]MDW8239440.1 biotin/lipoyl-containing protein [Acidobacteriota bacterium]
MHPTLPVLIDRGNAQEGIFLVRAPAIGLYRLAPRVGAMLSPGSVVGRLRVLHRDYELLLPPDVWGQVGRVLVEDKITPVEYGQVLFELRQRGVEATLAEGDLAAIERVPAGEGGIAIVSPTDGVFYLKPHPTAEPYVRLNDRVSEGQVLGLVEVMKCFNPIQYGGPDLPEQAEVVEICVADGAEIKSGQVLFRVRSATQETGQTT